MRELQVHFRKNSLWHMCTCSFFILTQCRKMKARVAVDEAPFLLQLQTVQFHKSYFQILQKLNGACSNSHREAGCLYNKQNTEIAEFCAHAVYLVVPSVSSGELGFCKISSCTSRNHRFCFQQIEWISGYPVVACCSGMNPMLNVVVCNELNVSSQKHSKAQLEEPSGLEYLHAAVLTCQDMWKAAPFSEVPGKNS